MGHPEIWTWKTHRYRRYSKIRCLWFIDIHGWFMVDNSIHLIWNTPMGRKYSWFHPLLTILNHASSRFLRTIWFAQVRTWDLDHFSDFSDPFRPFLRIRANFFFGRWLKSWGSMACHDDIPECVVRRAKCWLIPIWCTCLQYQKNNGPLRILRLASPKKWFAGCNSGAILKSVSNLAVCLSSWMHLCSRPSCNFSPVSLVAFVAFV